MLTQQQLGAAAGQAEHERTQMNELCSGLTGQLFFWSCLILVGLSYCTHETPAARQPAKKVAASKAKANAAPGGHKDAFRLVPGS